MVRMRMGATGSHAKVLLADRADGSWIAVVGSCNWLSSPFRAVEVSLVLRHPRIVADAISVLRHGIGRRLLADDLACELGVTANDLRRLGREEVGNASVIMLVGGDHEALMRHASGDEDAGRLLIATHRIGASVRTAAILPASLAAERGTEVSLLYTMPTKPMTKGDARAVSAEAAAEGVRVVNARKTPVHGKVLLWTPDNVAVLSHNWGSASTNHDFPFAEVGVHLSAPKIADAVLERLASVYPDLWEDENQPRSI
jgi:phosphatidylserine/phosphatidylglycerophosphate/cardiolipin synthase-like enzyme